MRFAAEARRENQALSQATFQKQSYGPNRVVLERSRIESQPIKNEVEAWWKEVESKGEEQVLIEAVIPGDDNAAYQAHVLTKKYPNSAVDAIRKGIANSSQQSNSLRLLSLLADHGSDEAEQLVRQQLLKGAKLPIRIKAAQILLQIGRPQLVIERMQREWKIYSPDKGNDHTFDASRSANESDGFFDY